MLFKTSGLSQRMKGLVAFSSASVDGTVGAPCARSSATRATLAETAAFPGSTWAAKRRLEAVYSWPQYTSVSSGRADSVTFSDSYICAGVPSNRRPQPAANSVSPVNTAPSPAYATAPSVCPGMCSTRNDSPSTETDAPCSRNSVCSGMRPRSEA